MIITRCKHVGYPKNFADLGKDFTSVIKTSIRHNFVRNPMLSDDIVNKCFDNCFSCLIRNRSANYKFTESTYSNGDKSISINALR